MKTLISKTVLVCLSMFFLTSCESIEYTDDSPLPEKKTTAEVSDLKPDLVGTTETATLLLKDFPKDETKVEQIENNEIFCMELYKPVCGMISNNCEKEPCSLSPQTFSNSCFAEKAHAKDIKEGACE